MARANQTFHLRDLEKSLGYAQAVSVDDILYISGLVSMDENGNILDANDFTQQLRNVYSDILRTLHAHGATFEHVVKEVIYTTDMDALLAALPIRKDYYKRYGLPAASWVEVARLAAPEFLVEVEITAHIPHTEMSY